MRAGSFDLLGSVVSEARLQPYLTACEGDHSGAARLYAWNIQISVAFQASLGCLEVACRNAMHRRLSALFGRTDWWHASTVRLHYTGERMVADAQQTVRRRDRLMTPDRTVAELPFGFWVSLLGSGTDYETRLWRPALRLAFGGYRGRRTPLHQELEHTRRLRNRIAHHEPVHARDLASDHERIMGLLAYVSADYAVWVREHDRVPDVLAARGDVCAGLLSSRF